MSEQYDQSAAGPGGPYGSQPPSRDFGELLRRLRRSRSDRMIAGVAGGLARQLRVDPVLVRVILVALVFVSGAGLLIYAIAWLLVPDESDDRSVIDRALGGHPSPGRTRSLLLGAGLIFLAVTVIASAAQADFGGVILFGLLAFGAVFLLRRADEPQEPYRPPYVPPAHTATMPQQGPESAAPTTDPEAAPQAGPTTPAAAAPSGPFAAEPQPAWAAAPPQWAPPPARPPKPPKPPKEHSPLTAMVLSALLVVLGAMAAFDAGFASIPAAAYFAAALAVVGGGLIAATWFGRARGLIALGTLLAVALPLATAAGEVTRGADGEWGDFTFTPQSIAQLRALDKVGGGETVYDLTDVPFPQEPRH